MREYGKVTSAMWADERLSETARYLLVYLHSGPHTNWIGCFRCAEGYASDDLGLSIPHVSDAFAQLVEKGWVKRCGKMVFLPGFLAGNQVENGNVATSRFKQFLALPDGEHKAWVAAEMLQDMKHLTEDQRAQLAVFISKTDCETARQTDAETVDKTVTATIQRTVRQTVLQAVSETVSQTVPGTETVGTVGIKTAKAKAKAKKIEIKDLKGGVGENFADMDESACPEPDPTPAPLAQAPSVCDGWIFAESAPAEPAAPIPEPEPPGLPNFMSAPSVQDDFLFDGLLFADDKLALTPEEEDEVEMLLSGESPLPQSPPQPSPAPIADAGTDKAPKRKRTRTLGIREVVAEGATPQHAEDWLCVRKAKHAPLTITAWDEIKQEGKKAGLTPAKVVEMCAARGWRGFKASWLSDTNQNNSGFNHSQHSSSRNRLEPIAI